MEYKILEKIQNNLFTLVFLIKNSKKKYILKRQKILNKHIKKNLKYEIWREIDFSEFVNKLPKNKRIFFMQMYEYKIVENCDKKLFDKLPKIMLKDKIYKELDKSKYCIDLIYEHKGKQFKNLLKKNNLSLKEKYYFLVQLFYALSIMKKNGYSHNDIHPGNITYNTSKSNIKIKNKNINSKYVYSLIDYGLVNHKKYNLKKNKFDNKSDNNISIFSQILNRKNILIEIYKENKWKLDNNLFDPNKMYFSLLKMYDYKEIWNKIKEKLLKKFPEFIKFYNFFENSLNLKEITDYIWNPKNNTINITEYIDSLFLAYDSKNYYKIFGLNKLNKNSFIPGNDIEFIILNFYNYNKLVNYFLSKN